MALDADAGLREVVRAFNTALASSLEDRAALAVRLDWLEQRQARSAPAVAVPAVSVVAGTASVDVTLTWAMAWPDTSYTAVAWLETPASLLGKTSCVVKTKTKTTCVVTVTTGALLAAGAITVRGLSVTG